MIGWRHRLPSKKKRRKAERVASALAVPAAAVLGTARRPSYRKRKHAWEQGYIDGLNAATRHYGWKTD